VDDAFGGHRAHASVVGVPKLVAEKGAGLLLEKEVRELSRLLEPERPFAAILGGAKISGKIDTLRVLSRRADLLLVGGGMANHFVRAIGLPVGKSLLEEDKVPLAREILDFCKEAGKMIALPSDFVVAKSPDDGAGARRCRSTRFRTTTPMGRGRSSSSNAVAPAETILNGPMGVFEKPPSTRARGRLPRRRGCEGGDGRAAASVQAAREAGVADRFTHVSTGEDVAGVSPREAAGIEALE
jgi:phosphoglycerate kinase